MVRVVKRSFILTTLLTPLAIGAFIAAELFIISYKSETKKNIVVSDESDVLNHTLKDGDGIYFTFSKESIGDLKKQVNDKKYNGIIQIPPINNIKNTKLTILYYSDEQIGLESKLFIESQMANRIRDYKIAVLKLDKNQLAELETSVLIDPEPISLNDKNESAIRSSIAAGLGAIMGFIMYMTVIIYGMMVMRSVAEEKTNRIIEVMISSVRPFELMMGKIIGVGGVGLTQIAIWIVLIPLVALGVQLFFNIDAQKLSDVQQLSNNINPEDAKTMAFQLINELHTINWMLILPLFIFYFVCGYFLYASLFAAVGSAISDDMGESQSLVAPLTLPIALAFFIVMNVVRDPHSSLGIWASIFPLFSPIVMPAILAFDPPLWQILTSVVVLIASVIFFVWLSARIYRIGILMYGKKATFKELGKWLFYRD